VNVYTAFDANGQMKAKDYQASRKVHRFAFHSLDFMDDEAEMMPVDIIEVTKSN
jgi:hypothetical protein